MTTGQMKRSAVHDTFTIEKTYPVPPARVFAAFGDPKVKAKWMVVPEPWHLPVFKMDFREGGEEIMSCGPVGGELFHARARFQDIVPNERIVYSHEMHAGTRRISVSLTTIEFSARGNGTQLRFTEQGVFLDEPEDALEQRRHGTEQMLETVGQFLSK